MASILLQAGHSADYVPYLPGGGGAPGEANWTSRFVEQVERLLAKRGISVVVLGGWLSNGITQQAPAAATRPYNLAIFCHYDADIYGVGGGFIDRYRPENWGRPPTGQLPTEEAFMTLFDEVYFPSTGILNKPNRRNPNTSDYYAYRSMHKNTPRVLIEFGVGAPGAPDSYTLWQDMPVVAETLYQIIEQHFVDRGLIEPDPEEPDVPNEFAPPISREEALQRLQQLGFNLPDGFAITERAIASTRVNGGAEWRGPAMSDEYPYTHSNGRVTTRRDFTAGSIDYDASTGEASWAEVVKEARE